MAAVVNFVSRRGLSIDAHHTNQPSKSKLALYRLLIHVYSHKQLYICNKTIHYSYKGGCGVCGHRMHINVFKRKELA